MPPAIKALWNDLHDLTQQSAKFDCCANATVKPGTFTAAQVLGVIHDLGCEHVERVDANTFAAWCPSEDWEIRVTF